MAAEFFASAELHKTAKPSIPMAEMKIAPVPAVPAGAVPKVFATAVPVSFSGGRTAMLQPQAKFPPEVSSDYLQGTGCSSKVDCTNCFSSKDFAMIDGQRFYLSFNSLEKLAPVVRKQLAPSAWFELFRPHTDVIVAINGVCVGVDKQITPGLHCGAPNVDVSIRSYMMNVLAHAIQSRFAAGPGATVPFVVLRQTGVGEAAYLVLELPVDDMDAGAFGATDCCGSQTATVVNGVPLAHLFTLVAYSPETWASVNKMVCVKSDAASLRKGDVLLAINGRPVDGEPELAHRLLADAMAEASATADASASGGGGGGGGSGGGGGGGGGGFALVKRGPVRPETKPQFLNGRWAVGEEGTPFKEGCGGAEVLSIGPSGWFKVLLVPLPLQGGTVDLEAGEYSVGGWPKLGLGVDKLAGRFVGAAGCWALECMRGQFTALSAEDDPSGDMLRFSGCKLYSDLWMAGGNGGGVAIPCLCFPFPICYTYIRERGGNRFNPNCHVLPCYGPWIGSFHGFCCTESGTFTDEDTFESACDCCGKMTRRM